MKCVNFVQSCCEISANFVWNTCEKSMIAVGNVVIAFGHCCIIVQLIYEMYVNFVQIFIWKELEIIS